MTRVRKRIDLRAFQLFETVARRGLLTAAAEELGITQSAVSHGLRSLSERLGEELIERRGRTTSLTAAGKHLGLTLASAFDLIEEGVSAVEEHRQIIRLGIYSSFAVPWLIERLPAFQAANPAIDLRLVMLYDPHEVTMRVADIFVTSEPERSGYWTARLFAERVVPVGHPDQPGDFSMARRFISAEVEPGIAGRAWEAFGALNGLDMDSIRDGGWLCCSHYILALELVMQGLGAALLPDFMVERHIADGRLLRLPGSPLPTGQSYELHLPFERRREPAMLQVAKWMQGLAPDTAKPSHVAHPIS